VTYIQTMPKSRDGDRTTWPIGALVLALHALLFVMLMRVEWTLPPQPLVSAMTLVELRLLSKPEHGVSPSPHPSTSVRGHAAAASPALAKRKPMPPKIERSMRSDSAIEPEGIADATSPAANPANQSGDAGGRTGGLGATGGGGAKMKVKFRPPQVVRRYTPTYPEDAFFAKREGSVDVMVTIAADASVRDAHVYRSSGDSSLDRASVDAAAHYVFRPARRGDDPTEAQAIVTIDWNIVQGVTHWARVYQGLNAIDHH
jgi:protein TonB